MKISYNWLQSYFREKLPPPNELAGLLTLHSFEVESHLEAKLPSGKKDTIFQIDVLPNRAHDCLSYIGLAREVGVILGLPPEIQKNFSRLTPSPTGVGVGPYADKNSSEFPSGQMLALEVTDEKLVPRAIKQVLVDVEVKESPTWLKERLASMGQKSINNIVDVTNYVMFETGQPVHSFDYERIADGGGPKTGLRGRKRMIVRPAQDGEKITTLDGVGRTLDSSMLVIADSQKALDIAGVKGGANSQITEKTRWVVLSACNFSPVSIRKTSRKLGLLTDASKRFEQGLAPELAGLAINRLTDLVLELTGGKVSGAMLDFYPKSQEAVKIEVTVEEINNLLGLSLSEAEVSKILDRFGWKYSQNSGFKVAVPFERLDLEIKEDLIEEIGRIYGYDKIKSVLPEETAPRQVNKILYYQNKIRQILAGLGFSEIYNYSLVKEGDIGLANPLSEDKKFLRSDLETGLEEKLDFNLKYADLLGLDKIKVFEFGKVFTRAGERLRFALGLAPIKKGEMVEVIKELNKDFDIDLEGEEDDDRVAEFDFDEIVERLPAQAGLPESENLPLTQRSAQRSDLGQTFKPFSPYPFIVRDVAVWVSGDTTSDEVLNLILKTADTDLLVNSRLFDVFEKGDKKSYAFRLVFQSQGRTLTDDEVNKIMEKVTAALNVKKSWQVR